MNKIFYENIFISDFITNKSLTIEEMLELIDFDEREFIEEHGFEALDPADFKTIYFNFEASLPGVDAEVEGLKDLDGSDMSFKYKRLEITSKLSLILFDEGIASLEFAGQDVVSFHWDEDMEYVASRLVDGGDVGIRELFVNIEDRIIVE